MLNPKNFCVMILNLSSVQEQQVLDYQFRAIDPRPSITAPSLEHEFRASHFSPVESLSEEGTFIHSVTSYQPKPIVNSEGVVSIPINFGAAPMSQIEAAQFAQAAVDRLSPTQYEQDNL